MSGHAVNLPGIVPVAGRLDEVGDWIQETRDTALLSAVQGLAGRVDLVTTAVGTVTAALADDPTHADLVALKASVDGASAKLTSDPAESADVQAAATAVVNELALILAKQPTQPALSTDFTSVVSKLDALIAKIPTGGATDAHVDLVATAVTAAASVLPTNAATEAKQTAAENLLTAINAKLPSAPASQADIQAVRDRIILPSSLDSSRLSVAAGIASDQAAASQTLAANVPSTPLTLRPGDQSWWVAYTNSSNTNSTFEAQIGGTWVAVPMTNALAFSNVNSSGSPVNVSSGPTVLVGKVPPGATAVRVTASIFSGTPTVVIGSSQAPVGQLTGSQAVSIAVGSSVDNTGPFPAFMPFLFGGANFDRQRGNVNVSVLGSGARTTTTTASDTTVHNARGVKLVVSVTAISGAGITPRIEGKTNGSGSYYTILTASAAITATGVYTYVVYPGVTGGATQVLSGVVARTLRAVIAHGDSASVTYSVDAELLL